MIYDSGSIAKQLQEVCPVNVAVAYIGKGWARFLDSNNLGTVVVSPDLGSNPVAIVELAEMIGWENVLLLENLHSKIYIGLDSVMLGSANLSNNAFGETTKQEEACVVLRDGKSLQKAQELFDDYAAKARVQFPDEQSKVIRVEKLRLDRRKHNMIESESNKVPSFGSYKPSRDGKVYLAWYVKEETGYTDVVPDAIQREIVEEVHLSSDDMKPQCQWILNWLLSPSRFVDGRSKPEWVYVHEVFEDGCDDKGYEMLCIQRASLPVPPKPFDEKEPNFVESFQKVMNRSDFSELREGTNSKWRLQDNIKLTEKFISELHKEYL